MRGQERVKRRENDFRVLTPLHQEQSLGDEPVNSRFHEGNASTAVALPASGSERVARHRGAATSKKRNPIRATTSVPGSSRETEFSIRFLRLSPPPSPSRRSRSFAEITLRCANDAIASRYINRLYGSLRGLTIA